MTWRTVHIVQSVDLITVITLDIISAYDVVIQNNMFQTQDMLTYSFIIKCDSDFKKVERKVESLQNQGYTVNTYILGIDRVGVQAHRQ